MARHRIHCTQHTILQPLHTTRIMPLRRHRIILRRHYIIHQRHCISTLRHHITPQRQQRRIIHQGRHTQHLLTQINTTRHTQSQRTQRPHMHITKLLIIKSRDVRNQPTLRPRMKTTQHTKNQPTQHDPTLHPLTQLHPTQNPPTQLHPTPHPPTQLHPILHHPIHITLHTRSHPPIMGTTLTMGILRTVRGIQQLITALMTPQR